MGRNLPSGRQAALTWLESIVAQWNTNQAAIGITSASIIDLTQDVVNARGAFSSVELARTNAKSKTQDWYSQIDDTHKAASDMISTIKSYAATQDPPSAVYTLAGLTPKDPPQPAPVPDQPTSLLATLQPNGSVTATWDGKGPSGTVYQVYRKLVTESAFTLIDTVGAKTKAFNDPTVPSGIASAMYQVRAQHGEKFSIFSGSTSVIFGTSQSASQAEAA